MKLATLLMPLPSGVLAQGFDYASISAVAPEELPTRQRMAADVGQSAGSVENYTVCEVSDVIADDTNTVVGYLVDSGGFLGIGEKHVFVPKDQAMVRIDGISVELVIQLNMQEFAQAFARDQ